ncbi:wax ester/triacylglycerol synthase family O-acyltransferase [Nevskia sp.]|uniref:WS/DGAT/MGAT family O-acyltransferase n=1 Tax=Nevskia sp. TaxID=1929292 RepID=UPI0025FF3370|nr:wax ester/triacylglycerol synthase family O-acyltransferase [Nevskia sp.]
MSATKRLNPLDWTFLAGESGETMMMVGALMPFSPPPDADDALLRRLMDEVRAEARACPPWNFKLRYPNRLAHPLQRWVEDDHFDVEYHIRRSALPSPGDERELGILVSRLHSNRLDFQRPPWEVHFIEGLEGGRFAIYFKVHHALVDGYTGIKLLSNSLSSTADERDTPMFFSIPPKARAAKAEKAAKEPTLELLMRLAREQLDTSQTITRALKDTVMGALKPEKARDPALMAPMQAPKSILNQKISRNRRFATQQFSLERLKRVAKSHGGTLNDLVLALCATALRRLLFELEALPAAPLTAMLPVNVRPKDDPGGGNAVGAIIASLATDIADPKARFKQIIASTAAAKAQLQGMTRNGILQYGALLMAPLLLARVPGTVGRIRPAFNLVISNVPGPTKALYFRGFKLEAYYPLSIPMHGYGLNITVVSYGDQLNFGFIGCRDGLPHLQRLAVYSKAALDELDDDIAA